jgi:sec-independent protein translocase protein TatC
MRTVLEHIEELRKHMVRILISVAVIAGLSFVLSIRQFTFEDVTLPLPYPDPANNLASQVIDFVKNATLPKYVQLIVTSPGQAFLSQMYASIFLGVLLSTPVILYEIAAFISPGLYENEKRLIRNIMIPTTILFIIGCAFGFFFVVPFSMDFLYGYAVSIGAQTFITLDELISFVFLFVLAFGVSFELPVIMWALSTVGLVKPQFWKNNWRYAVVAITIFGAVITPDGSGITMWFVALPMMALYAAGYLSVRKKTTSSRHSQQSG